MLNEKRVMLHKLFIYTLLSCSAGFLAGVAGVLGVLCIVFKNGSGVIYVVIAGFSAAATGMAADRVYQQIRTFINRPYLEELEEKE